MSDYSEHLAGAAREIDLMTSAAAARDYDTATALAMSVEDRMRKARLALRSMAWKEMEQISAFEAMTWVPIKAPSSTDANAKLVTS